MIAKRDDGALLVLLTTEPLVFIYFPKTDERTPAADVSSILGRNRDVWEEVNPVNYEGRLEKIRQASSMFEDTLID